MVSGARPNFGLNLRLARKAETNSANDGQRSYQLLGHDHQIKMPIGRRGESASERFPLC